MADEKCRDWIENNGDFQRDFRRQHQNWSAKTIREACELADAYAAAIRSRLAEVEKERDEALKVMALMPSVTNAEIGGIAVYIRDLQACYRDAAAARNGDFGPIKARAEALQSRVIALEDALREARELMVLGYFRQALERIESAALTPPAPEEVE